MTLIIVAGQLFLQNIAQYGFVSSFLKIRLRLYICGKNSKEVMLYSSQGIMLVDVGLISLIAGDVNFNHLARLSAVFFLMIELLFFPL